MSWKDTGLCKDMRRNNPTCTKASSLKMTKYYLGKGLEPRDGDDPFKSLGNSETSYLFGMIVRRRSSLTFTPLNAKEYQMLRKFNGPEAWPSGGDRVSGEVSANNRGRGHKQLAKAKGIKFLGAAGRRLLSVTVIHLVLSSDWYKQDDYSDALACCKRPRPRQRPRPRRPRPRPRISSPSWVLRQLFGWCNTFLKHIIITLLL